MRKWGHVLNRGHLQTCVLQVDDRLLAAGAGTFHFDLDLDHPALARLVGDLLGCSTGGERGALAGALETDGPGRRPGDRLAVGVGDGDDRVVERRLNVRDPSRHAFTNLLLGCAGFG